MAQCSFVLYRREELAGERRVGIVVDGERVDIGDLLVEAPLARADLADPLEQVFEVVLPESGIALLQAVVIEDEALDDELAESLGSPDCGTAWPGSCSRGTRPR
jgi:hypothetical protein